MENVKKTRVRLGKSKYGVALDKRSEITFIGNLSNMAGGFNLFEMGCVRMVQRTIKREEFISTYCSDISSIFELTNAMEVMLKYLLGKKMFYEPFVWCDEVKVVISKDTGISVSHVDHCFRSMVSKKRLFRKIKHTVYRLNPDYFVNPQELKSADFLGLNIRYVFEPDSDAEVLLQKNGKGLTMDDINKLIEIYNEQKQREGQIKGMLEQ